MSDHHILAGISRHLRHALWMGIKADEATRSFVLREPAIRIASPDVSDPDGRLFLWLYEVRPNRYLASHPGVRPQTGIAAPPPLPLDLHYMITPLLPANDQDGADLVLLARVMQIMAAMSHLVVAGAETEGELRVTQEEPVLEEQIALWSALRRPMHLSAFYQVGVARINPLSFDAT
jgi:hypothetical protein